MQRSSTAFDKTKNSLASTKAVFINGIFANNHFAASSGAFLFFQMVFGKKYIKDDHANMYAH